MGNFTNSYCCQWGEQLNKYYFTGMSNIAQTFSRSPWLAHLNQTRYNRLIIPDTIYRLVEATILQDLNARHKFLHRRILLKICSKGCPSKNVSRILLVLAISQLIQHQNLKFLSLPLIITRALCGVETAQVLAFAFALP